MAKKISKKEKSRKSSRKPKPTISTLPIKMTLSELQKRKEEIETLLASLEDEYREATVSEKSYNEIKKKNLEKLEEVKQRIQEMKRVTEERAFAPLPVKIVAERAPEVKKVEVTERAEPEAGMIAGDIDKLQTDVSKLTVEVEKLKTMIDSIKEIRSSTEDKIQRLMESIGEIRSLVFQREAKSGDESTRVEKLSEMVSEMKPEKIATELSKRDKEIATHEAKLEKLEFKSNDMLKTMKSIQKTLESMGSLENVVEVSKNIAEKNVKIEKNVKDVERLTDKVQKLYVELSKNLENFITYKAKQEEMDELTKELVKTVDQINIKLDEYAKTEDVSAVKFALTDLEKKLTTLKTQAAPKEELPPELQELQKEREEIETLIKTFEEEYQSRKISEEEFKKVKETNLKKLAEIDKKIKEETEKLKKPVKAEIAKPETPKAPKPVEVKEIKEKIEKVVTGKEIPPVEEPKPKKSLLSKKERLAFELNDLFEKGLITQDAFERTKKLLSK
jgi:DNA repair exonuclease SbcCD ATPase subunit